MGRTTKVLLLPLLAVLALSLGGCFDEDTVTDQEIQKAERTFKAMMQSVEKACIAAENDSGKLPALRRAYVVSLSRFLNAREDTYDGGRDEADGLPDKVGSFEETAAVVCPGVFKLPPPENEEEE